MQEALYVEQGPRTRHAGGRERAANASSGHAVDELRGQAAPDGHGHATPRPGAGRDGRWPSQGSGQASRASRAGAAPGTPRRHAEGSGRARRGRATAGSRASRRGQGWGRRGRRGRRGRAGELRTSCGRGREAARRLGPGRPRAGEPPWLRARPSRGRGGHAAPGRASQTDAMEEGEGVGASAQGPRHHGRAPEAGEAGERAARRHAATSAAPSAPW
jgi:ribonuclease E